jgi:hypothetical protein
VALLLHMGVRELVPAHYRIRRYARYCPRDDTAKLLGCTSISMTTSRADVEAFSRARPSAAMWSVRLPHRLRTPGSTALRGPTGFSTGLARSPTDRCSMWGTYYGPLPVEALARGASRAAGLEPDPERFFFSPGAFRNPFVVHHPIFFRMCGSCPPRAGRAALWCATLMRKYLGDDSDCIAAGAGRRFPGAGR